MKNKYVYSTIFALIAFFISSYLTILHFKDSIPPCTFSGCEVVLTSKYSEILGVPVALFGAIFYLIATILSTILLTNYNKKINLLFVVLAIGGFTSTLYFIFLQIFIIKEFCQYCLATELMSLGIFLIAISDIKKLRAKEEA